MSTLILSYTITQASTSPKIEAVTVYANEFVQGVDGTRAELCPRQGRERRFFVTEVVLAHALPGALATTASGEGRGPRHIHSLVNLEAAFAAPGPGPLRMLLRLADHALTPGLGRRSWPGAASPEAAPGMDLTPQRKESRR